MRLRRREIERLSDMPWIQHEDGRLEPWPWPLNFGCLEAIDRAIAEMDQSSQI